MKLTIGSLFAGIGGIELGLERTRGFVTKWQVEQNEYCLRVLRKHWPNVQRLRDITEFQATPPEAWKVDVITGGFPCQPVSLAGKRKGDSDERWLWEDMLRVCQILKPRWIVAENVRGLLSADGGRLFGRILGNLATCGYCVEWSLIPACSMGAPHTRERLFIVAYPDRHGLERGFGWAKQNENLQELSSPSKSCGCTERRQRRWQEQLPTPVFCRGSNGIPNQVDRLKCLGNAVVPQVAEWIGYQILEYERWLKKTSGADGKQSTAPLCRN